MSRVFLFGVIIFIFFRVPMRSDIKVLIGLSGIGLYQLVHKKSCGYDYVVKELSVEGHSNRLINLFRGLIECYST